LLKASVISAAARWAIAEGMPERVIAAVLLLDESSVDEIVAKLRPCGRNEIERQATIISSACSRQIRFNYC